MGIRFYCPNGHKLNVKEFQAGRRGICPFCGARTQIPTQSTRPATKKSDGQHTAGSVQTLDRDDNDAQASDSSPDILPGEPPQLPGDPGYQSTGGKMLGPSTAPGSPVAGSVVAPPASNAAAPSPTYNRHDAGGAYPTQAGAALARPPAPMPTPAATMPARLVTASASPVPATAQSQPAPSQPAPAPPAPAPPAPAPPAPPQPQSQAEPPDPIAEAPDMIWYIRPPSGGQFGPAPGDLMRTWIAEGRVSADSLIWREGWRDWQEAGNIFVRLRNTQFVDVLESAPVPSVAAPAAHPHQHKGKSHRADRSQLTILIFLILAVTVLAFVLIYLLKTP